MKYYLKPSGEVRCMQNAYYHHVSPLSIGMYDTSVILKDSIHLTLHPYHCFVARSNPKPVQTYPEAVVRYPEQCQWRAEAAAAVEL